MFQAHADSMEAGTAQRHQNVGPNTVPPRVQFRDRQFTDKWWGVIYALSYIAFLSTGFFLVSKSHARYEIGEDGTMQISAYHLEDAKQCCSGDVANADSDWGVCAELNNNGRRLISGNSRFQGDEGMFDVFILAPEIIVVLVGLTLGEFLPVFSKFIFLPRVLLIRFSCFISRSRICLGCRTSILCETDCYSFRDFQNCNFYCHWNLSRTHWLKSNMLSLRSWIAWLCILGKK